MLILLVVYLFTYLFIHLFVCLKLNCTYLLFVSLEYMCIKF